MIESFKFKKLFDTIGILTRILLQNKLQFFIKE